MYSMHEDIQEILKAETNTDSIDNLLGELYNFYSWLGI